MGRSRGSGFDHPRWRTPMIVADQAAPELSRRREAVRRFSAARMAEEVLTVYRSCATFN
jgi:hypothetical protein